MPDMMSLLESEETDGVTILRLQAKQLWDDEHTEELFHRLGSLVESATGGVALDLSMVEFFASSVLGKLVALSRRAQQSGIRMVLCNATPVAERALQITRLDEILLIYANEREARESFRSQPSASALPG